MSRAGLQFWKVKMLYFHHKWWYRARNLWKDIYLGVPTPGDDKNLAGLASFDFRILQCKPAINKLSTSRAPKGFRAPGLRPKKCRYPGLQEGKLGAVGLHRFTSGLHLGKNSIFVRAPSRERLWVPGSTTKILGLQGSKDPHPHPFGTWTSEKGKKDVYKNIESVLKKTTGETKRRQFDTHPLYVQTHHSKNYFWPQVQWILFLLLFLFYFNLLELLKSHRVRQCVNTSDT